MATLRTAGEHNNSREPNRNATIAIPRLRCKKVSLDLKDLAAVAAGDSEAASFAIGDVKCKKHCPFCARTRLTRLHVGMQAVGRRKKANPFKGGVI